MDWAKEDAYATERGPNIGGCWTQEQVKRRVGCARDGKGKRLWKHEVKGHVNAEQLYDRRLNMEYGKRGGRIRSFR